MKHYNRDDVYSKLMKKLNETGHQPWCPYLRNIEFDKYFFHGFCYEKNGGCKKQDHEYKECEFYKKRK